MEPIRLGPQQVHHKVSTEEAAVLMGGPKCDAQVNAIIPALRQNRTVSLFCLQPLAIARISVDLHVTNARRLWRRPARRALSSCRRGRALRPRCPRNLGPIRGDFQGASLPSPLNSLQQRRGACRHQIDVNVWAPTAASRCLAPSEPPRSLLCPVPHGAGVDGAVRRARSGGPQAQTRVSTDYGGHKGNTKDTRL